MIIDGARKPLLIIALAGAAMALGEMAYQDDLADQQHYCEMAAQGYWPEREYCGDD